MTRTVPRRLMTGGTLLCAPALPRSPVQAEKLPAASFRIEAARVRARLQPPNRFHWQREEKERTGVFPVAQPTKPDDLQSSGRQGAGAECAAFSLSTVLKMIS